MHIYQKNVEKSRTFLYQQKQDSCPVVCIWDVGGCRWALDCSLQLFHPHFFSTAVPSFSDFCVRSLLQQSFRIHRIFCGKQTDPSQEWLLSVVSDIIQDSLHLTKTGLFLSHLCSMTCEDDRPLPGSGNGERGLWIYEYVFLHFCSPTIISNHYLLQLTNFPTINRSFIALLWRRCKILILVAKGTYYPALRLMIQRVFHLFHNSTDLSCLLIYVPATLVPDHTERYSWNSVKKTVIRCMWRSFRTWQAPWMVVPCVELL